MNEYLGTLMQSRTQAHIFHLQADSYEFHKTLQTYYEGIVDLIDDVAENFQGKYGIVTDYKMVGTLSDFESDYDNIDSLIRTTLYKLKYLG
jgi:DNA-binding ferritin-like protein